MPDLTADDVRETIKDAVKPFGSIARWAEDIGVSPAYALDVLRGKSEPGPKICTPLGLERVVMYRRIMP